MLIKLYSTVPEQNTKDQTIQIKGKKISMIIEIIMNNTYTVGSILGYVGSNSSTRLASVKSTVYNNE